MRSDIIPGGIFPDYALPTTPAPSARSASFRAAIR
jgi:hypothetical protein